LCTFCFFSFFSFFPFLSFAFFFFFFFLAVAVEREVLAPVMPDPDSDPEFDVMPDPDSDSAPVPPSSSLSWKNPGVVDAPRESSGMPAAFCFFVCVCSACCHRSFSSSRL